MQIGASEQLNMLPEATTLIHEARRANGTVFVHCPTGVSSSAVVAVAYLMRASGLSYEEVLVYTRTIRPSIDLSGNNRVGLGLGLGLRLTLP